MRQKGKKLTQPGASPAASQELNAAAEETGELIPVDGGWEGVFHGTAKHQLEAIIPAYIRSRRWYGGKARHISSAAILEAVPFPYDSSLSYITLTEVRYVEGGPDLYLLPVAYVSQEESARRPGFFLQAVVAHVTEEGKNGILYEALVEPSFCRSLLDAISQQRRFTGSTGDIVFWKTRALTRLQDQPTEALEPSVLAGEQSNSSIRFGDRVILKLFRRLADGVNPDLEIGLFLTEQVAFPHIPALGGAIEYHRANSQPMTLAILQALVENEGDAWGYTRQILREYFDRVARLSAEIQVPLSPSHMLDLADKDVPSPVQDLIGSYLQAASLLGRRTAELHLALASNSRDTSFVPEPFSLAHQRFIYQSMHDLVSQIFETLRKQANDIPAEASEEAKRVLALESKILGRLQDILERNVTAMRIRIHGDYHLGQVLYTGRDFVIIDFEGEPARPLAERRTKRSPLCDVAGMLRSFHYAVSSALFEHVERSAAGSTKSALEAWATCWNQWVGAIFLKSYLSVARQGSFLPEAREELRALLEAYLLEKSVYELGYELNNRPAWLRVPLKGILQLMETD
jgi:maltose alpha-D-glucosyltransferase/alpha-amylase